MQLPETEATMFEGIMGPQRLLNKNFLLLCSGQVLSSIGSQFSIIALAFWVKHATESAAIMGSILMIGSIPAVLLGPIAGTLADRFARRRIIIICDILNGLAALSLAGLMVSFPENTSAALAWLAVVTVFAGTMSCFLQPALIAAIPDVVPVKRLASANSVAQFLMQATVFLGQGTGGLLYRLLGAPLVFAIDGLTFLVSALCAIFTTIPQTIPEKSAGLKLHLQDFRKDLSEGFWYVWRKPGLRELLCISALMVFFTSPVIVLLPFFIEDVLKLETDWYGYIIAVYGVGSMAGFLLAGVMQFSGKARYLGVVSFIILESAGYALLGLVRNPVVVMLMAFAGGAAGGFVTIVITTILQATTPSEFRGRVFAILGTISGALAPVAMGLSGVVADMIDQNISLIYIVCGTALAILSLGLLASRSVKNFISQVEDSTSPPAASSGAIKKALVATLGDAGYDHYARGLSAAPGKAAAFLPDGLLRGACKAEFLESVTRGQGTMLAAASSALMGDEKQGAKGRHPGEAPLTKGLAQELGNASWAESAADLTLKDAMIFELRKKLEAVQTVQARLMKEIEMIKDENARLRAGGPVPHAREAIEPLKGVGAGGADGVAPASPPASEVGEAGMEPAPSDRTDDCPTAFAMNRGTT